MLLHIRLLLVVGEQVQHQTQHLVLELQVNLELLYPKQLAAVALLVRDKMPTVLLAVPAAAEKQIVVSGDQEPQVKGLLAVMVEALLPALVAEVVALAVLARMVAVLLVVLVVLVLQIALQVQVFSVVVVVVALVALGALEVTVAEVLVPVGALLALLAHPILAVAAVEATIPVATAVRVL
jgi:hypothetical protein